MKFNWNSSVGGYGYFDFTSMSFMLSVGSSYIFTTLSFPIKWILFLWVIILLRSMSTHLIKIYKSYMWLRNTSSLS